MKTVITNGIVLTMDQDRTMYPKGYVVLDEGKILQAGPMEELGAALPGMGRHQVLDAGRAIVMPGMVNTHCHLGMVPFRGLGDDCKDRLRVFLLPMEQKAMDAEMAVASSRYAICELLLAGVTTVLDMYYFEEQIAQVMDEMGIRGIAGQTVMEEGACDLASVEDALAYGEAAIKRYKDHPRVSCSGASRDHHLQPQDLTAGL